MAAHDHATLLRLRPGVRVSRRGDGQLQVGLHADQRAVVPDQEPVRRLLDALGHGLSAARVAPDLRPVVEELVARGLLDAAGDPVRRRRLRAGARVGVHAPDPIRATAVRMLAAADLVAATSSRPSTVLLHVTAGAEPRREGLDAAMRSDLPHLPLTVVAGRVRLGPLVVPGLTACVRCVDEHLTDRDPRHPLVLEQHTAPDPSDQPDPADLQLALGWAARDLRTWIDGGRPVSWSASVDLAAAGPRVTGWERHPRCGCAWGDLRAG